MKNRLIILALGLSPPGTMGGNSKITVEMARCLAVKREVHFILPENKLATLTDNVPADHDIRIHAIPAFVGEDKFNLIAAVRWFTPRLRTVLREISARPDDFLYCCSDFHIDVLPPYALQKEFGFRWLPSVFLFVPFVFENLSRSYKFPAIKYLIYWTYQQTLFALMKRRATGFVVTNRSDFDRFPKRFSGKLFDYYGGVNIEQIPSAPLPKCRDVVFCSRLHPQKGIDAFLDTWKEVLRLLSIRAFEHSNIRTFKLTIIGNGSPTYEAYLKDKAQRLGISDTIEWLGYVNNEAKFKIYAQSRVFVHPTVFDNNGMVAAEALCTGLPVVMQDLPALRDVYTTGCIKVPFGDRNAFAAAVVSLLTDPAKYAATAPNPDQLAALRAHWKWENRAAEFDQWLDELNKNVLSYAHAQGTGNALHDGQPDDGGGLHPFTSRRERALSDLSRIRVLAEALSSELLRTSQHGERASVRELTAAIVNAAKPLGLYRPYESQIAAHLASLGLKPENRYFFGNDLLAVTDVGATSDNVLLDDSGRLRFIDPLIRLKKPATEVIDTLCKTE